jgi:pimeloyl-ACP methyl ester carboxylesterase
MERGTRRRLQRRRVRRRRGRLLDALGLPRVDVVGHDWGGFAAILLGLRHPERVDRMLLANTPGPWAPLNARTVVGLRRAWYAGLVATPLLGERVVSHPRFVPWFLRLGGQAALFADEDAALYAEQFRDPARAAAASRLYRYYLQTARVVLLRRAFAEQRLEAPTRLLFGDPGRARGQRRRPHPRGHLGLQSLDAGGAPRPRRRPRPDPVRLTMSAVPGPHGGVGRAASNPPATTHTPPHAEA